MDQALTAVSIVIGVAFTVAHISGRVSGSRASAVAVIAVALTGAIALGLFDIRILGFAILTYWVVRWLLSLVRRAVAFRLAPKGGTPVDEAGVDRTNWPISGPIGRLGGIALATTWLTTQLLTLLNPFLVLEICRQVAGNASLSNREKRSGDDGRGYRTRAVYTLPFAGEWLLAKGGHTPKTSHSWDILNQRFALDFVQANEAFERHTGRGTRAADYFCYGREILAAADGTVVRVENRVRRAFLGWGVCDFLARSFVGNHVLVEHAEGEFALYAHLVRGSVTVAPGDRVRRGQTLGRCGHSGNSTEPHLHFQLQDAADLWRGMGLPVRFSHLFVDGEPADGVLLTAGNRVRSGPDVSLTTETP